jgi:hypothetical protein
MEEIARCEERERAQSMQAWGVTLTSKREAAPRKWNRLELNLRPPQAALLARREAGKSLPEEKTGREARGSTRRGTPYYPCSRRDLGRAFFQLERNDD